MARLVPMNQTDFAAFLEEAIPAYAEDKVRAGNWQADEAIERSRAEFHGLLPDGPTTADNYLYMIEDDATGDRVGRLWVKAREADSQRTGFVYDVIVFEPYRRRGYAFQAFQALETKARELGLTSISLHVFGDNLPARALYRKLGYVETNVNMRKML